MKFCWLTSRLGRYIAFFSFVRAVVVILHAYSIFHVLLSLSHVLRFCNSSNAIKHLASADHLKNLKHFFWKYGGDVERLDDYRILEADVAKVTMSLYFF